MNTIFCLLPFLSFCHILKDFISLISKYNLYWTLMTITGFVRCTYLKLKFDLFIYSFYIQFCKIEILVNFKFEFKINPKYLQR